MLFIVAEVTKTFGKFLMVMVSIISAYCQQLEDMISEKIDTFTSLRDKARNFRKCLNDEEAKSRQLMNRHY